MAVQQVLQSGQIAGLGQDDARVHHDGLEDHPGDLAPVLAQHPVDDREVVESHDDGEVGQHPRDAGARRDAGRPVGRAGLARFGVDRYLHRVMVAVVTALDLDDQVAASDRPHQVHRVHGGLGARVNEPPLRQAEAAGQFPGDGERIASRLGEVRAAGDLVLDRGHDRRVPVASQRDPVSAVHVDVLVAVDVVELRSAAVAEPDGLRAGDLPA